ncbi:HNH endonuclease signature motif containing protein [Shinella zoogloeoides]|uniref:HNH endonuclease signature motif containing protein n=1 Tax=Shinella zoogloeoides TaxID=352475 RepID=UPI00322175F8
MLARDRERKARHDAQRPTARERGYDSKWDKERAVYLKAYPNCAMCGRPAALVDHKTPHKGDKRLFWSRSNWQPLCTPCHSSRKQSEERRP